ncbi:MAG: hypothetical protein KatS3mg057_1879 [Herpetosiphonaceae bacterium]|nr:MAG: hypothetical protein KatS3mg057_1879 [Herpetosiphonaceae bacterium]
MYLGWFDDNPKKALHLKISEAIEAYEDRFGDHPNIVLVNEAEVAQVDGIEIQPKPFVRRNYFWVGRHEPTPA